MATERIIPGEIRIFLTHIYEFKKGVRNMVLYTMSKEHEEFAIRRLKNQKISYMIQEVGTNKINLLFGKAECMEAMRDVYKRQGYGREHAKDCQNVLSTCHAGD